jgi:hypothetical protein
LLGHDGVEDAEQVQIKREEAHGTPFRTGNKWFIGTASVPDFHSQSI